MRHFKRLRASKTIWFNLACPPLAWAFIVWNGGSMPVLVQWWGPVVVCVGNILLRIQTDKAVVLRCRGE